ncbi:hypothetical protein IE81DRAFT_221125 [Ceraceosorus guamensis]|uniref:BRCT domain-containing protein n=1 Tax=Ceraceosorus guamensis TaxID=1522189 RepID=A0A316VT93_9BASI|nr:hypothetical protein IE81DRAFT_221125 [Ceraceosorus guamensis]PWN40444.1 hypothetical protein IE81DRAFT_221125 [Ceraceosorus guamensis]
MSATNRTTTTTTASRPCKPINERKITSHSRRLNVPHRAQRVLSNLEGFYPKSGRDLATGHVTKDEAKSKANEGEEGRNGRSEEREEREEGGMMLAIRTNRRAPATSDWRRFGRERRAAELLGQLHGQGRSGEKARSYAYRPKQSHLQWTRSEQQQLTGNAGPSSIRGGDKVVEHNAEGEINPSSQPVTVTRRDSLPAEVEGMSEDVEDEEEDWWRNLPSEEQIISSVALADDSKERSLQDRGASIVTMMTDQEVRASRSDEIDSKEPRTSNTDVKIFGAPPVPLFSARAATERASLTSRQGLKRKDNPLTHFHHDSVGLRTTHYTTSSTGHQVSNRLGPGAPGATWWDTRLQKLRSQACEEESDLFKGIVAYVNGFTGANTTRREVVRLLQMHGAKVVIMPSAKTTHIFTAAFLSASKAHKVLVKRRGGLGPKILHVQ